MAKLDKIKYLHEHKPHFGVAYFVQYSQVGPGDVLSFIYDGEMRWVMVLDPDYKGKMHALTLGITPRKTLIDKVIDPMYDHGEPYSLYYRSLFKVAKDWDNYRTYNINKVGKPRRMAYYIKDKPVFKDGVRVE
ncbi:MAG: hypothetical protein KY428_12300 [Bacteroidetes bacterium]|nr:hypothetical protein [Bacteroidota bacterium]